MFSFNLINERWIPCIMSDSTISILGLKDVLSNAHEIVEISDKSPLVTIALHRLLLAIIHRNFERGYGPLNETEWANLWNEGKGNWNIDQLFSYLDKWRDRFDLFDKDYPFYQCPQMPTSTIDAKGREKSYAKCIANLAHEIATGNNATLFDHTNENDTQAVTTAEAVRLLVAFQAFTVGGLLTYERGQDSKHFKSADNAPLVKGAVTMVKGQNLFQTLMLNLHKYNFVDAEPFEMEQDDAPSWERDEETLAVDRQPKGYLDLLTWQSRRIRLIPEKDETGQTVVKQVVIMKGNQFPGGYSLHRKEPMLAFRKIPKPKKGQAPWLPVAFQEDHALWRDSLTLFQSVEEERARPNILSWVADLSSKGIIPESATYNISIIGLTTNKASISMWRHERLPLSLRYLEDEMLVAKLREALDVAEKVGGYLNSSIRTLARVVITPEKEPSERLSEAQMKSIDNFISSLSPARSYWASLGVSFNHLVTALPNDVQPNGEYGYTILPWWANEVRRASWQSFREAVDSLDHSGRWLKAVTKAEDSFSQRFNTAIKEFLEPYR